MIFTYCTDHHINLITELHVETTDIARHRTPTHFAKQRGSRIPTAAGDIITTLLPEKLDTTKHLSFFNKSSA